MKRIITLFILLITANCFSQDPVFSQFYSNPVYLNPALAGSNICPRLSMNNRNQWANISGAYVTNSVSYDGFVRRLQGGLALMITNDMAGKNTLNWSTVNLAYSYHLKITRRFSILIGAQSTWNQIFLDWAKLTFGDQIDPKVGFVYQSGDLPINLVGNSSWSTKGFFDVSTGIVGFSDKFYFGFAAKHMNTPNQSLGLRYSELPMRLTGHIGLNIPLGEKSQYVNETVISPNIIYTNQGGFMQCNFGGYIQHGAFTLGTWLRLVNSFRDADAFILSMGINTGSFRFGYSYDLTISSLTNASGGSHELSLGFDLPCKQYTDEFRTVVCPSF